MKRVIVLIVAVVFSTAMYAQETSALSAVTENESLTEVAATQNPELEKQIKDALMSDENLQESAINYLKENPETASSLADIVEANEGSLEGIISAVLGDSDLTSAAIGYIKNNPEMIQQVMKLAGM